MRVSAEYDYGTRSRAGTAYEGKHNNPETASVWCLHIGLTDPMAAPVVLSALDHPTLTGEYVHDFSFTRYSDHPGSLSKDRVELDHLVVYLRGNEETAVQAALTISRQAFATANTLPSFVLTTAGDWSAGQHIIECA